MKFSIIVYLVCACILIGISNIVSTEARLLPVRRVRNQNDDSKEIKDPKDQLSDLMNEESLEIQRVEKQVDELEGLVNNLKSNYNLKKYDLDASLKRPNGAKYTGGMPPSMIYF